MFYCLAFATLGVAWLYYSRPVLAVSLEAPATRAGNFLGEEFALSDDTWIEEFPEEGRDGSPVDGGKVALCHKGITIVVSKKSQAAHMAHGDTLGPCLPTSTAYTIVCVEGTPRVVTLNEAAGYLSKKTGTLGLCNDKAGTIMCNKSGVSVAVAKADIEQKTKDGWKIGPCQGKAVVAMCRNGKQIMVPSDKVASNQALGVTLGACPKPPPKK
jgi:hypothetical protein